MTKSLLRDAAGALTRMMRLADRLAPSPENVPRIAAYKNALAVREKLLGVVVAPEKVAEVSGNSRAVR